MMIVEMAQLPWLTSVAVLFLVFLDIIAGQSGESPCDGNMCKSNELCVEEAVDGAPYRCICAEGFTGTDCLTKINCGDPGNLLNGARRGIDFTYKQTVSYSCNFGYTLTGSASRTCQLSSVWDGIKPSCQGNIQNGVLSMTSSKYKGSAVYKCNSGYYIQGSEVLLCLGTGQWDSNPPSCLEEASNPCEPYPCGNKGSCFVRSGKAVCQCSNSYTGDRCQNGPEPRKLVLETVSTGTYVPEMADSNSDEFKAVCSKLSSAYRSALIGAYPDTFLEVKCLKIRNGSLIVEFEVFFDPVEADPPATVGEKFNEEVSKLIQLNPDESLYIIQPEKTVVKTTSTDATTDKVPTSTDKKAGDLLPLYIISSFASLLVIILIILFITSRWRRERRRRKKNFSDDGESSVNFVSSDYSCVYGSTISGLQARPSYFWRSAPFGFAAEDFGDTLPRAYFLNGLDWSQGGVTGLTNGHLVVGNGYDASTVASFQGNPSSERTFSWKTVSNRRQPRFGVNLWSDTWARRPKYL